MRPELALRVGEVHQLHILRGQLAEVLQELPGLATRARAVRLGGQRQQRILLSLRYILIILVHYYYYIIINIKYLFVDICIFESFDV